MVAHEKKLNFEKMTKNELKYVNKEGFWSEHLAHERVLNLMDAKANRDTGEDKKIYPMEVNNWEVFVPTANTILSEYMDIISLFPNQVKMGEFLDFMFKFSFKNDVNGLSPFYFHEQKDGGGNYVFDYSYLVYMIIEWSVVELEADRDKMMKFMKVFGASNKKDFLRSNHFLTQGVLAQHYLLGSIFPHPLNIKNDSMAKISYCNETIIKSDDGEEFYFLGVPIRANSLLKFCSKEVVMELFRVRHDLNIHQYKFGKAVKTHRAKNSFFRLEFPD